MIELRGSTWDHARGYDPLPATAEAYQARHPDVRIVWERRTLRDFAEMPIPALAERVDLIVLDHPWLGATEAQHSLLPLDEHLEADFLEDQARHSVGKSNASYVYRGHQWALAIDAASQVSAYRPDLLERLGAEVPRTWETVLDLARRVKQEAQGWVGIPLMHVDTFPCFFTLCANAGEAPFASEDTAVSRPVGRYALDTLRALAAVCHPGSLSWNPPQLLDRMSATDEIVYCPLLFGYSNYARPGHRPALIRFTNIPAAADGIPRGAILGGAGLAISSRTAHPEIACDYAAFVASADTQRTIYFDHNGQPGHRRAWLDPRLNAATNNFFLDTLPTLDHAALRPRYTGWIAVQDGACRAIHGFLSEGGEIEDTLDTLDDLYRRSLG
jgi:multiple sugar transport system substrate-binding protein